MKPKLTNHSAMVNAYFEFADLGMVKLFAGAGVGIGALGLKIEESATRDLSNNNEMTVINAATTADRYQLHTRAAGTPAVTSGTPAPAVEGTWTNTTIAAANNPSSAVNLIKTEVDEYNTKLVNATKEASSKKMTANYKTKVNFNFAAHLGLSTEINPGFKIDLSYSFRGLGKPGKFDKLKSSADKKAKITDATLTYKHTNQSFKYIYTHNINLGLRFEL
ncbi:hypothetical protein [Rickettsia endosymbiont of Cardiosporidium cionae]|uniref:hypothetical protein n=1 Tax=Rickettsia endosymbiont of Cardiosporidium cionae TaxID=2777155 RepID=UPI001894E1F3|nr:hypothetical protein [Rickettsia endosymbiont of Cardiosporidium cionae]KAF8818555.1 hypothetical protein IHI24_000271 [Rickettsia endosymbiont of Cardiosporidium cionae]